MPRWGSRRHRTVEVRCLVNEGEEWVNRDDLIRYLNDCIAQAHRFPTTDKGPNAEHFAQGLKTAYQSIAAQLRDLLGSQS